MTNQQLPAWLKSKPAQLSPELESLLRKDNARMNGSPMTGDLAADGMDVNKKPIQGRWIFVSFGMPEQEIKAAAVEAAATDSILVFRGVEKDGNTGSITKRLYPLVKKMNPVPKAVIDPLLFTRFNITVVPSMVETNSSGETRWARGLPGFNWLSQQDAGDLGKRGPVFAITEPDMIEELQRRMENHDWEKEKNRALENFWVHQEKDIQLPSSQIDKERIIDPSIVASKDIFSPNGQLIVAKGQRINPQEIMPMKHAYIVFDATDKDQVDVAKKTGDQFLAQQKPVVYLFSKMRTDKGWDHYNQTTALLNAPIYKLNKTIVERFMIEALPSVIEGNGDKIMVKEISVRK